MKVWIVSSFKGYVIGVFLHIADAYEALGPNDTMQEWEVKL